MLRFLAQQTNLTSVVGLSDAVLSEVDHGRQLLYKMIEWFAQNGAAFIIHALVACVILLVGTYVIRALVFSTRKALQKSGRVNVLLESFFCNVTHKIGWIILLMLVLQKLGIEVGPLVAGVGVVGFIVGFACQESLANLAAGVMIALNQPFRVGDFVSAGGVDGSVTELNMMATTLLTPDYKRITVPNKVIWGSSITNFSDTERRRVEIKVGIVYGSDIAKAKRVALDTFRENPLILADPPPAVEVAELGTYSVNLVLRPWSKPSDYWNVHFSSTVAINDAFVRNGIQIAFPEQIVRLRNDAPAPSLACDGDRT
ncbi:MAG: mechanosensitive ion channel family protein [Kiritimatiellaeota bacterium]|nr:mechanosensitive ion channel family protein [Kiritimatiellota bacterium]